MRKRGTSAVAADFVICQGLLSGESPGFEQQWLVDRLCKAGFALARVNVPVLFDAA